MATFWFKGRAPYFFFRSSVFRLSKLCTKGCFIAHKWLFYSIQLMKGAVLHHTRGWFKVYKRLIYSTQGPAGLHRTSNTRIVFTSYRLFTWNKGLFYSIQGTGWNPTSVSFTWHKVLFCITYMAVLTTQRLYQFILVAVLHNTERLFLP